MKTIILVSLFLLIFVALRWVIATMMQRRAIREAGRVHHHLAAVDTLLAAAIWLTIFQHRISPPETILGLSFNIVYVVAGGAFFFADYYLRIGLARSGKNWKILALGKQES